MTGTRALADGWTRLRLPPAVAGRLQALLDRQDAGDLLGAAELEEAGERVDLAEMQTLLRLRCERR